MIFFGSKKMLISIGSDCDFSLEHENQEDL